MPLTLSAAGRTLTTATDRVLVGAADHADVQLPDGPYLAAVIVHYESGWVVHPLADDPQPALNGIPLRLGHRARVRPGSALTVGRHRIRMEPIDDPDDPFLGKPGAPLLQLEIRGPDGLFETRSVEHDLLVGRLPVCEVSFPHETKLSRLAAMFAAAAGRWHAVVLSRGPIAVNRHAVTHLAPLDQGDLVQIGPFYFSVALRTAPPASAATPPPKAAADPAVTPAPTATSDDGPTLDGDTAPGLYAAGLRLDAWLKDRPSGAKSGVLGWVRGKVAATADVTTARVHRSNKRFMEALAVLDPAVRAHPDSEELLRELCRLYRDAGLPELAYRPLREIEKAREATGKTPEAALLRELAEVCRDIGPRKPEMYARAMRYWQLLETTSGTSTVAERHDTLARQAMSQTGFATGRA